MKAVLLKEFGPAENLYIGETEKPVCGDEALLVRIKATALNRADVNQRQGSYPPPPGVTAIIGLEMAGEVEEVGSKVTGWKKGDRIAGLLAGGGYAQYCVIHHELGIHIPDNLTFEEAAGIPEIWLTAYQALFIVGNAQPGKEFLIHAGASGVSTAAIQLLKSMKDTKVYVTTGSEEKIKYCLSLGVDKAWNYKQETDWEDKVIQESREKNGVDFVLDFVGANYFQKNLKALKLDGTMVILGMLSGSKVDNVDISYILRKRLTIKGSTLRNRPLEYKINLTQQLQKVLPKFVSGEYKSVIDKVFDWKDVVQAHRYMEDDKNKGKIILKVD
eukprot:TRINITY_DN6269_c0_g2_i1.p1 TRINITY_DN6269_c0_g2~~TRINITY_DN6269_c0_g2_i1.p1  ORF type:complete len:330 (-),score=68.19 TRINITY_DN6269_c0_g2_i1:44-1033(-)